MDIEEANKVLEELYNVRPEKLNKEGKRLFEAIMSIADERDRLKKIIDMMATMINNHDIDEDLCKQMGNKKNCSDFINKELCKNCIKEYFYKKAEEESD